jgi:hypothetical protein
MKHLSALAALRMNLMHIAQATNGRIPQRALKHLSPVQALKNWQTGKPNLFVKRVYNQTGLDS